MDTGKGSVKGFPAFDSRIISPFTQRELDFTEATQKYDDLLPSGVYAKELIRAGEFSTLHKVALVDGASSQELLGYIVLENLYAYESWMLYMQFHNLDNLWIDKWSTVSLVPNRGIGSALWNISNRIVPSSDYRAIVDTSDGWTKGKIEEAQRQGIFSVVSTDVVSNYGVPSRRYLVKYN